MELIKERVTREASREAYRQMRSIIFLGKALMVKATFGNFWRRKIIE